MESDETDESIEAATTASDAKDRSLRTFLQGVLSIIVIGIATAIVNATGTIEWSLDYWSTIGTGAATVILTSIASYVMRYVDPPE